ncbi:pilus assembly protein PilM [Clostridium frigoris]|uniref:Pilus assembly protein PilM n=1 Tax=Clostridium frigoris TaxID=205327 RepID=A0ABS6BU32_9CLOT|nr:pilus assembly protein PilM [Clostridium frigoris]MBU3160431.1 pilus assembly protein PilM [Clostridium frigoris]
MEKLKKIDLKKLLNSDLSSLRKQEKVNIDLKPNKPLNGKKFVSLDIGSQNTKVVVGKCSKNKIIIEKAFMFRPSVSFISETNTPNLEVFPKEIEIYLSNNKVKLKDANCTSNSTTVISREVLVPEANDAELETMVKFELQHYLPINMDDYIVQYSILEKVNIEDVKKLRILAVIYPRKLAENYMELLRSAKLRPYALDVNYNTIKKLIQHKDIINEKEYDSEATIAVIDMGAESLEVNIYTGDKLEFTRIIKSGGKQIDLHIGKIFQIGESQAEVKKIKESDLLNQDINDITKIAREDVEEWLDELGRIFRFFKNKNVDNKIEKIFIHGGSSRLKGIEEFMGNSLNVPVKRINTLNNVELKDNIKSEDIVHYLNAIGAIIRI